MNIDKKQKIESISEIEKHTRIVLDKVIKPFNGHITFEIDDLRNGKCAVKNDGTREQINHVLRCVLFGTHFDYYWYEYGVIKYGNTTNLPVQSVSLFLTKDAKKRNTTEFLERFENIMDKISNKSRDIHTDIQSLKDKYPQFNITVSVEERKDG